MRSPRSLDTIFMPGNLKEEIREDLKDFLRDRQWYDQHSIVWKRGVCLHGDPGGGKSSLVLALANTLKIGRILCPDLEQLDNHRFEF